MWGRSEHKLQALVYDIFPTASVELITPHTGLEKTVSQRTVVVDVVVVCDGGAYMTVSL